MNTALVSHQVRESNKYLVRGHLQTEACTLNVTVTLLQDPPPHVMD